ncbi:MAG: 2Fe-2S iron-sulfur cluster binding domain-containing protein [Proteobacteria bacterium]|nr:2Fe-2S iron-sulfur cluster binding domain-containing protein [Pseudomonadota bacterium]NIS72055.1 2Fe-2S iron-sulfur cluster binding domain-containing protein [Pseudomonadota bacterium]
MKKMISFVLNGNEMEMEVESHWTLLYLLREHLELTGTKSGCESGECGACTVLVDSEAVNACLFPVMEIEGARIATIEGMAKPSGELHPLQRAFVEHGAIQCGYCTPGMIMAATGLLNENPNPTEDEIRHAIAGNICRCTGYLQIIKAIKVASETTSQGGVMPRKAD